MSEPVADRFRFRIYVAGKILHEAWTSGDDDPLYRRANAEAFAIRQRAIAEAADREDLPWLVEVFDAHARTETAYIRFGTDTAGMTDPSVAVQPGESLSSALADHPSFKVDE